MTCAFSAAAQTVRIDELKAQITANPESYELGAWQVELAEQLLATLSVDGADTSVLYGIPTHEQEDRVRRVAAEALRHARASTPELQRGADAVANHPEFADRRDLQDRRSELAVEFALIRQPLAEGRAAALLAKTGDRARESEAMAALDRVEAATPLIQARRWATLGALRTGRDSIDDIRAFATEDRIGVIRADSPHLARELSLARARAVESGLIDIPYLQQSLIRQEQERPLDGLAARELIAKWRAQSQSANRPPSVAPALTLDAALEDAALANLILEKSRRMLPAEFPISAYAIVDRIALGREVAANGDGARAIEAYRSAWNTLEPEYSIFKRLCGWDLARALRERGAPQDIAEAGAVLLELALFPDEPNAEQALSSAIELLQWSDRALATRGVNRDSVSADLRRALRLGLTKWPNAASADEWRLALANIVTGAEQRELLEYISARSAAFPRARLALAWLTYREFAEAPSDAQREALAFTTLQYADQAREAAAQLGGEPPASFVASVHQARAVALAELRRFVDAAEAAIAWNEMDGRAAPDAIDIVRRRAGDALRESLFIRDTERAAAIAPTLETLCAAAIQRVLSGAGARTSVDSIAIDLTDSLRAQSLEAELVSRAQPLADHVGVTRGVGIALATGLRANGDHARAFQTLRDVVDASRALDVSDDLYWRAWAGMLEILSDQNESGARTETILRQIARLKAEDSALGGELIKRRIEAVERQARLATPAP